MRTWILRICGPALALLTWYGAWIGHARNVAFAERGRPAVIDPVQGYNERVTTTTQVGITVDRQVSHDAFVSFRTEAGQRMRVSMNLPDSVLAEITAGRPVMVEYLPDDPQRVRFRGREARYGYGIAMGALVLGLTALFWRQV